MTLRDRRARKTTDPLLVVMLTMIAALVLAAVAIALMM